MPQAAHSLRCATAVLRGQPKPGAAQRLVDEAGAALDGARADAAVLLASGHYLEQIAKLALELYEALEPRALVGATGEALIAGGDELEGEPALALWAASLPGARVQSFHMAHDDLERLDSPLAIHEHVALGPETQPTFVLLGDPYSINPLDVLARLERAYPGRPAVGGMASAADRPRRNAIIFDGQALRQGLCGMALCGGVTLDTIVSQGCRPIGRHLVITKAERNVIYSLGGRSPLAVVREIYQECSERDRDLARQRGLLIGCAINEYQPSFGRGDFLIRNPIRFDSDNGALEVADFVRTGQTVQFHVRDGESAAEDLATLLERNRPSGAAGALLFSCNGRGTRLFPEPHHDAQAVRRACGELPLAGFFCAGEIGPIGNRNFLHGHTASIGFLRAV